MYDIIIIGSGPAGLSAAIYAKRAMLSTVVLEKDYGGLGAIAVTERVDNYPALYGISGYELGEKFREHAEKLGAEFEEFEVSAIEKTPDGFAVSDESGKQIKGKSIIYAAGTSNRKLAVTGADRLNVSYCATCDGAFFHGQNVAVIGGGDTALSDALYLSRIAKKVYIIHRRDEFRANQTLQAQIKNTPNIELFMNAVPTELIGEKKVEGLRIRQNGEEEILTVNGVFSAIGTVPNTQLLKDFAELDSNGYIIAGENGVTSLDGFFAAGDVRTKALRQVITAAADGASCVQSAEEWLRKQ